MKVEIYYIDKKDEPQDIAMEMIRAQLKIKPKQRLKSSSGACASVYVSPTSNIVYKMGFLDGNEGYVNWVKQIIKTNPNPLLPKIYGIRILREYDTDRKLDADKFPKIMAENDVLVVAMEKLTHVKRKTIRPIVDWIRDEIEFSGYNRWGTKLRNGSAPPEEFKKLSLTDENYKEVRRLLNKAKNQDFDFDFHHDNFMLRNNKEIVFTDPIF